MNNVELIRKSDAIHAVLHNMGDAAVAAVQGIKPVFTFTDGLQEARKVKMPEIKTMTLEEWRENNNAVNPFFDMEQIKNYKIYGYKVRDLILFADMCKRNDVQEADLKQAAWNLELASIAYFNATIENICTWEDEKGIYASARYVPNFEKAYAEMMGKEKTDADS